MNKKRAVASSSSLAQSLEMTSGFKVKKKKIGGFSAPSTLNKEKKELEELEALSDSDL
jgi:hypothetical protein